MKTNIQCVTSVEEYVFIFNSFVLWKYAKEIKCMQICLYHKHCI